jgi:PAS domain-containing protein
LESQKNVTLVQRKAIHNSEWIAKEHKILLDNSFSGLLLLSPDCRILEINQTGAEILVFDLSKDLGKSLFDFLKPEKSSAFFHDLKDSLDHGDGVKREEYEFTTFDGSHK